MDLDSNNVVARMENTTLDTTTFLLQYYVGDNTFQAGAVIDDPAVIPAVNDLRWHTALGFSLFTTYHLTVTESPSKSICPDDSEGVMILAT